MGSGGGTGGGAQLTVQKELAPEALVSEMRDKLQDLLKVPINSAATLDIDRRLQAFEVYAEDPKFGRLVLVAVGRQTRSKLEHGPHGKFYFTEQKSYVVDTYALHLPGVQRFAALLMPGTKSWAVNRGINKIANEVMRKADLPATKAMSVGFETPGYH